MKVGLENIELKNTFPLASTKVIKHIILILMTFLHSTFTKFYWVKEKGTAIFCYINWVKYVQKWSKMFLVSEHILRKLQYLGHLPQWLVRVKFYQSYLDFYSLLVKWRASFANPNLQWLFLNIGQINLEHVWKWNKALKVALL